MLTEQRTKYFRERYKGYDAHQMGRVIQDTEGELRSLEGGMEDGSLTAGEQQRAEELLDLKEYLQSPINSPAGLGDPGTGSGDGWNLTEFIQAVVRAGSHGARPDERLYESRSSGLEGSTPSLGGFLVNKDFETEVVGSLFDGFSLPGLVRKIEISSGSNGIKIPALNETSRADGSRQGGVRSYWVGEGELKTASKPAFRLMELNLDKLVVLIYASDELMQDATALRSFLMDAVRREVQFQIENVILNGDGSGKPLGVLQGGGLISVSKTTGQPADTIIWENIKEMYARFKPSGGRGVVVCNRDVLPQLFSMVQTAGTGGVPVWLPANNGVGRPQDTLLGMPVIYSEASPTLGDAGDILMFDPDMYIMATKQGTQFAESLHLRFLYDESIFRWVTRLAGQPILSSAIAPFKGSATIGPYVTLEERA